MRRYVRLSVVAALVTALVGTIFTSPAQAATNPYTPEEACHNDHGGSWSVTTDGHRTVQTSAGVVTGDVYLLYNYATGDNCVAVIKSAFVGTPSQVQADIWVEGDTGWTFADPNFTPFSYYETVTKYGAGKCVMYWGYIQDPTHKITSGGGRNYWGNCA